MLCDVVFIAAGAIYSAGGSLAIQGNTIFADNAAEIAGETRATYS